MEKPEVITLYGRKYAKTEAAFTASLFDPSGTCHGFYRAARQGVYLCDMQGLERAFIRADGLGPVTTGKAENGKRFYMFSTSSRDETWLGVPESYSATIDGAKTLAASIYGAR